MYIYFESSKNKQEHKNAETIKEIYEPVKVNYFTVGDFYTHDILPAMANINIQEDKVLWTVLQELENRVAYSMEKIANCFTVEIQFSAFVVDVYC